MSLLTDAAYVIGGLAGVGLTAVAVRIGRRRETLGVRAFVAYLVVLGAGSALVAVAALLGVVPRPAVFPPERTSLLVPAYLLTVLSTIPLLVFALQFTGRRDRIGWGVTAALGVMVALFTLDMAVTWTGFSESPTDPIRLGSAFGWSLLSLAYAAVSGYLLVGAGTGGRPLRLRAAVALVTPIVVAYVCWLGVSAFHILGGDGWAAGAFAAVPVVAVASVGVAVGRDDAFETEPAVRRIGRRAVLRETDDLVVVADDDGRVVELNDTASRVLGIDQAASHTVESVLGHSVAALDRAETVALPDDRCQYDPQVSHLTDHRDRRIGAVVSLRDVTDRERREQRLAVLNRVLRHNLRNQVDVIRAHAESLDAAGEPVASDVAVSDTSVEAESDTPGSTAPDGTERVASDEAESGESGGTGGDAASGSHAAAILETADSIAELGEDARTIDQFISESGGPTLVDVTELVTERVEAADPPAAVSLTTDLPAEAWVTTDETALRAALDSALDNAVEHADRSVTVAVRSVDDGTRLVVRDDGPGLPEAERTALDTDRETALRHGTGLGLWKLRWAVRTLDGTVSVSTDDGTTVEITVPDREK